MNFWLQLFQTALDLLKKPWKVMLALLILSICALYAPYSYSDPWLRSHGAMEWGCLIFAAVYLCLTSLAAIIKYFSLRRRFNDLSGDERRVILAFMKWNTRTTGLISGAATGFTMVKMGVLEIAEVPNKNNLKTKRGDSFFTIKPWVFRYFKNRPHLYSLENEIISDNGVSFRIDGGHK
ncbi:MAG TPA: hypothetical protein VGG46_16640 [Terriglobales bacterium]|jgi:hypothetical protein